MDLQAHLQDMAACLLLHHAVHVRGGHALEQAALLGRAWVLVPGSNRPLRRPQQPGDEALQNIPAAKSTPLSQREQVTGKGEWKDHHVLASLAR